MLIKEFREAMLHQMETGKMFAYQALVPGAPLEFSNTLLMGRSDYVLVSLPEVRMMFANDEIREKSELN